MKARIETATRLEVQPLTGRIGAALIGVDLSSERERLSGGDLARKVIAQVWRSSWPARGVGDML